MLRWLRTTGLLLAVGAIAGCNTSVKELGPVDASKVPQVNPDEVKNKMNEAMKHMPPGAKMPNSVVPGSSGPPAEAPAK